MNDTPVRVLSHAHPTRPSWSAALPVVHAEQCRDTVRRMYFARKRRSTGISHYQFAMLVGENLERKMGKCNEKSSFGVLGVRDVVA
jgi:hypothetical protein